MLVNQTRQRFTNYLTPWSSNNVTNKQDFQNNSKFWQVALN